MTQDRSRHGIGMWVSVSLSHVQLVPGSREPGLGERGLETPPLLMPVGVCRKSRTTAIIPIVQRRKLRLR